MKRILSLINKVSPSTRFTLTDQIWVSGCNFLQGILITRLLGLEVFGQFALAWMLVLLGSGLHQAFITAPMMSLSPSKTSTEQEQYFLQSWGLQVYFALLLGLLALISIPFFGLFSSKLDMGFLVPSLPVALVLFMMQEYWRRIFFIRLVPQKALILDIIAYGGMLAGIFLLGQTPSLNLPAVFWIIAASFGGSSLLGWAWVWPPFPKWKALRTPFAAHWDFSRWLLGKAVMQFFAANYFTLAAGALMGPAAMGAIRIVQQVMGVTHVLFLAMENIVPVKTSIAFARDGAPGMIAYLRSVSLKSGLVVFLILAGIALSAPHLLSLLFGSEYAGYGNLLMAWCLLYCFVFPGYPMRFALRTLKRTRPIFVAYGVSTLFSLLCASFFVSTWELMGVVAGMTVSQIIMQSCYAWSLYKNLNPIQQQALTK